MSVTTAQLNGLYEQTFVSTGRQRMPVGIGGPGVQQRGQSVTVFDGRELQDKEAISEQAFFLKHSFVLLPHATAVSDWDRESVTAYHAEVEQVIRDRLFSARKVEVQQGPNVLRRGRGTSTPAYATGVHSDGGLDVEDYVHNIAAFSSVEGAHWWRAQYERPEVQGVVWVDLWRTTNMSGPLEHMPLALADPAFIAAGDAIPIALTGIAPEGRTTHHLSLRYNPNHRWYYYPAMRTDELLSFKLAEFWKEPGPMRNCFHTAFHHPETPATAEPRQSCEHRVGVLILSD